MIEWWKRCWKIVLSIPAVAATIGGIITLPSYVATPADLKQLETRVMDKIELDRNLQKLNNLNENYYRLKAVQKQYPKDKEIAEDLENVRADRAKIQQQLERR